MTIKKVLGSLLTNIEQKDVTKVLYLPCNKSQFDIALILAERSRYESYIYAEEFDLLARNYLSVNENSKVSFLININSVASFLPVINKIIVFIGSVTPFLSHNFNKIFSLCLKVKKDIYEVPHGLFQSGYNLTDDSKIIDTGSNTEGLGGMLPSMASKKLSWFGPDGFGYPRHLRNMMHKEKILPAFTLITSNTNWYLYAMPDKRAFIKEVFLYAKKHPQEIFIWCPHSAEFSPENFSYVAMEYRPANILLYGIDKDIYFNDLEGADDLIPYCDYAISTVSTCILDYEIHNKRVNIFSCDGVDDLLKGFISKHCFNKSSQISKDISEIRTGLLEYFDAEKFDKLISQSINHNDSNKHHYLSCFID